MRCDVKQVKNEFYRLPGKGVNGDNLARTTAQLESQQVNTEDGDAHTSGPFSPLANDPHLAKC